MPKYIRIYFNNQLIDEISEDIYNIHYNLYLNAEQKKQFDNITKIRKTKELSFAKSNLLWQ